MGTGHVLRPVHCLIALIFILAVVDLASSRVTSSVDFHFGIVRSTQKSLQKGNVDKVFRKEKKIFMDGSVNSTKDDEFENKPGNKKDCSVVTDCADVEHSPYRTMDGSCNNIEHPDWGSASQPYIRLLKPVYDDHISTPRTVCCKNTSIALPSARDVSRLFHTSDVTEATNENVTHMVMQWGQFLDHDISITPVQANLDSDGVTSLDCCDGVSEAADAYGVQSSDDFENCFPIPISEDDPVYNKNCMSFTRSVQVRNANCKISPVEQINQITAFIDASNVYGSSTLEEDELRVFQDGKLKAHPLPGNGNCPATNVLPFGPTQCGATKCFHAGDVRVNEQIGLASMHTLFVREHNRLAGELQELNPDWDDTRLFQESRKIVGAMMQVITYNEFLPVVLGEATMTEYGLSSGSEPVGNGNDNGNGNGNGNGNNGEPPVNPTIANVFPTAAYRFGHSQIRGMFSKTDEMYSNSVNTTLHEAFGNTEQIVNDACTTDNWLRGLVDDQCPKVDRFMSPEVTENLFKDLEGNSLDLAALNIQRGRDHGLPGYNDWRKHCKLPKFQQFDQLTEHCETQQNILKSLYEHPDDIDIFTAGVSEKPVEGGLVGETFACLLGQQFSALKYGDRFWYESECPYAGFTEDQIAELKKTCLSRVICECSNTQTIQPNSFKTAGPGNERRTCEDLLSGGMDLAPWKEEVPVVVEPCDI